MELRRWWVTSYLRKRGRINSLRVLNDVDRSEVMKTVGLAGDGEVHTRLALTSKDVNNGDGGKRRVIISDSENRRVIDANL